jgi:cyanate permease
MLWLLTAAPPIFSNFIYSQVGLFSGAFMILLVAVVLSGTVKFKPTRQKHALD